MTGAAPPRSAAPINWRWVKLKRIARLQAGDAIDAGAIAEHGDYPVFGGNGVRGYTSAYTHDGDYPLIGRQGALCGNVSLASGRFWASEHAVVVELSEDGDARWLAALLTSMNLNQYSQSAAQPGISIDVIANLEVPVPPVATQCAIADYLDRATARIDRLIAAKHAIIERLYERCDARILAAVGNSGLAQDGHNVTVSLRRVLTKRRSVAPAGTPMVTAYRDGQVTLRAIRRPEGYTEASEDSAMQEVQAGDVVIHGLDGFAGAIGTCEESGACSPVYHVCSPLDGGDAHYWGRMLRVLAVSGYLGLFVTSTRERAYDMRNWEVMGRIPVPKVPLAEQKAVGDLLRRIPPLRDVFERSLSLLREYRQALVTAAVFGELDILAAA